MAMTIKQLRSHLDPEEPDYVKLGQLLGPDDVPALVDLVRGADPMLASKAAYALTLIHDARAVRGVESAAASPHEIVRVASASGLKNLQGLEIQNVAEQLLADADIGVRKSAIKSAQALRMPALEPKLRAIATNDPEPGLRALANETLRS